MNRKLLVQLLTGVTMLLLSGCARPAAAPPLPAPTATAAAPTTSPLPPVVTPVAPTVAPAAPTPAPLELSAPGHRIGVRVVNGAGEFYDRLTGMKFIPRGFNYVRVAPMSATKPGLWHATLNPGLYEPERAAAGLRAMHDAGYNVVRVFVDCCREGNNAGDPRGGVSQTYLANVIDFLNKAAVNEIYVILVLDLTPAQGGYDEMWRHCCTFYDGENLRYLTAGGHTGERRFDHDFILALIEQDAPMAAIFAFDLTNEVHFDVDKAPFSLTSGTVTTANQQSYNMADPAAKQRMMDENLVYWIDQMRANILAIDPTALVTVSFPAINVGQTTVNPLPAIMESTADFVDLHAYMGWGLDFAQYMERFGVDGPTEKPLVLGEFGAARSAYPTVDVAARNLAQWQAASCQYGFDGWLLWAWDISEQDPLWQGVSENGAISIALSPQARPDPCRPVPGQIQEVAVALPPAAATGYSPVPAPIVRSDWISYASGNGIRDLALDHDGNLWAATSGGAVVWRNDGTYTRYAWENGLAGSSMRTVVVAPDGTVWFGGYGGVSRFDGAAWQAFTTRDGLAGDYVISSAAAADGTVWFGTSWSGAARFDGQSWTTYRYLQTPGFATTGAIKDVAVTADGALWLTSYSEGITRFDGQEWDTFQAEDDALPARYNYVLAVSAGDLWAGGITPGREIGLLRFDGATWRSYIATGSHVDGELQAIDAGPDGTVWLSTRDAVFAFDGENWRTYAIPGVSSILAGPDGAVWLGTFAQGILILRGQTVTALIAEDYLDPYGVSSIAVAGAGAVWFGGRGGVAHLAGANWRAYTTAEGLADDRVETVAIAPDGAVWVGTQGGVSRYFAGEWTTFTTGNSGLVNNAVEAIAFDPQGAVWLATWAGVSRFDGEAWQTYSTADGLANDRVLAVVVDGQGAVWFGTHDGVSRYDGQTWTTYSAADGLWNINPGSLTIAPDGTLWIGRINGLAYFDGAAWLALPAPDGLDSPSVGSIAFAPDGTLWCSLGSIGAHPGYGVGHFDGQVWTLYSVTDGLGRDEVFVVVTGGDGSVWLGTPAGVSRLVQAHA